MAFDESLARRVRAQLASTASVSEKRMFGGLAFLVNGHMSVAVNEAELLVRVAPSDAERALREPGVRVCDITGRPLKGWLLVSASTLAHSKALAKWVGRSVSFVQSLPPK